MKISCPHCGQHFEVDDADVGKDADCTNCGKRFVLQASSEPPVSASPAAASSTCPYCGGEIVSGVKKCLHCGEWLERSQKPKSPVIYVLLAVFLGRWGIHNFYSGAKSKGISKLIIEAVAGVLCIGWITSCFLEHRADSIVSSMLWFISFALMLFFWKWTERSPDGKILRIALIATCSLLEFANIIAIALFSAQFGVEATSVIFTKGMGPAALFLTVDIWCVWEIFHCVEECNNAK